MTTKNTRPAYFYIISNPDYIERNLFKIGKTLSNEHNLKKRYMTYFIRPIIIYHHKVVGDYNIHESNLKSILKPYRVENANGNLSEFIRMKLPDLIDEVDRYFSYAERLCESDKREDNIVTLEDEGDEHNDNMDIIEPSKIAITKDEIYVLSPNQISKKCTVCFVEKNLSAYGKLAKGKFGVRAQCNLCRAQQEKYRRELFI